MDSPGRTLTYPRMSGFATTAGQEFEMHLCALVFLRARNSGLEFQLGSNVDGAGALDDLVFRCKTKQEPRTWKTMFVQLKHREKSTVKTKMLTSTKEDFSLLKYFQSYLEIKQAMSSKKETLFDGNFEDSQFVIFTNAKGNKNWKELPFGNLSRVEEFIWTSSGSVYSFETDVDILRCLGECGDGGGQFLSRLRMFCGQPKADQLKAAVKEELLKSDAETIHGLNIERLCDCYLRNVKDWCESRKTRSEILDNDHNILVSAADKVRLESYSEQTLKAYKLELEFKEADLLTLGAGLSVVQSSDKSCRLSLTKLVQASQGQCFVVTCQVLLQNKRALLAEWLRGDVKRLIVCTRDWHSELASECVVAVRQMLDIGNNSSVQFIVFLHDGNSSVGWELTQEFQGRFQSCLDEFKISQLKSGYRDNILDKVVHLQSNKQNTTLRQLFNNDCDSAGQVLDASLVVAIMESIGPLTVGSALPEGIGYFVERTLELACVKASVFHNLQGSVTIRVTQSEESATGLLEKAIDFVGSLKDTPLLGQGNKENIVTKLYQSQLFPDNEDGVIYIGPKFSLGFYKWNCVGLRFGKDNPVIAFWVCPSKNTSENVSFLFVSKGTEEDDVRKLSEFHQSKHMVLLKDGQVRWIESHGDIELVRSHFDEDVNMLLKPETAMDVEDRLVLVCAEPGMGKSTLMARLAKNTMEAFPNYFVILLALNDYTKLFAKGIHTDALGFLSNASKMDSPLKRSLLKYALEVSGNVIVLADGFDEVAPKYIKECCQFLSNLLGKTKASKIWMTSRNSIKQTLEAHFSKFSAKLHKFDQNGQRNFLKKFWAGISKLSPEDLDKFIEQLLTKTSQAVRDKEKNFMGIPLQTQILAEVYEDHVTGSGKKSELPNNLDLLVLLEQFVEKKFRVYVEVKLLLQPHTTTYEMCYDMFEKNFIDSHSTAALSLILGDDDLKTLGMECIIRESSEFCQKISHGEDKTGFIVDIVNDKPRFIHRVFAEYFVAKWISEHFSNNRELIRSKMFTLDFSMVRTIFDRILSRKCPLHTAVLGVDVGQVRALLKHEVKLVEAKDDGGRTALHLAAGYGTSEDREENVRRSEILDLLIDKTDDFHFVDDVLGVSPLLYADITQSWVAADKLLRKSDNDQLLLTSANVTHKGMLETIFDMDLDRLLEFCLDHCLAVEHRSEGAERLLLRACNKGDLNLASLLINRNADIDKINGDNRSPLHLASEKGNLGIVKLLFQKLVSSCHFQENYGAYTNMTDEDGWTAMHRAAEFGHSNVISFLISQGGDTQIRNSLQMTPMHVAAWRNRPSAFKVLLASVDEVDRAALFTSCDDDGDNVLNIAAWEDSFECIELLVQAGMKLSQVGRNGETPLMATARRGNENVAEWLLHNFNEETEGMSKVDYINMKDKVGRTAMHHVAGSGLVESDVSSILISQGGDSKSRDCHNSTPLHLAAEFINHRALRVLLEAVNEADRVAVINSCDNDGDSVFICGALGGSLECVELLVQAGAKLSPVGPNRETPLMAAARKGKHEVVEWILHNFNAEREEMSILDFINMNNKDGKAALDKADADCRNVIENFIKGLPGQL